MSSTTDTATDTQRSTIIEAPGDQEELDQLHKLLAQASDIKVTVGTGAAPLTLPTPLKDILLYAVGTMTQGNAVSLESLPAEVTYHQAADLLGIQPYTLHRLVGEGVLAESSRAFPRRCLRLHDVLAYRDYRNQQRQRILENLAQQAKGEEDQ